MPDKTARHDMTDRETQRLRDELLRHMGDVDVTHVCIMCGCAFRTVGGRITCPFCRTEYVPDIG